MKGALLNLFRDDRNFIKLDLEKSDLNSRI